MRERHPPSASSKDQNTPYRSYPPAIDHASRAPRAPIGFHVTMRLEDDRPIATRAADFRAVARVVLRQGETRGLLAFGTAHDHLHAELATDRASAGAFAHYVETALRWQLRLGSHFEPARIRLLQDQRHAYNTFRYAHRQDSRHDEHLDAFGEGSSLQDLVGLRVLETSLGARVRTHLPRIRRRELMANFPPETFDPARPIDLEVLADASAAALALPDLRGRSPDACRARRAAVHAAGRDVRVEHVSDCLAIGVRAVHSFRALPSEPLVVEAFAMQARLRSAMTG